MVEEAETVRVFISYSTIDADLVDPLKETLERAGAKVWLDHEELKPGEPNWEVKVREGIAQAAVVIYAASPTAAVSGYVIHEIAIARGAEKRVIPFWVRGKKWEDCTPMGLYTTQHTDGRDKQYEAGVAKLLRTLGLPPVAVIGPPALVEAPAADILGPALAAPSAPAPEEARAALLFAPDAHVSLAKPVLVEAERVEAPPLESTQAGGPSESPTLPPPEPRPHGWTPALTWARLGAGVVVVALVVGLVVAVVTTQGFGLLKGGGSSSSRIPAATRTAQAALAQHDPTASYGPTAPGRCDSGPLASRWTAIPEDSAVTCASGAAQVSGPANLTFSGSGEFAMGSSFSITLSNLRFDSKDHCLDFGISAPRLAGLGRGEVHEKLCLNGALSGGSVGGVFNDEITSTIASTSGSVVLGIIVTSDTWTLLIGGETVASKIFYPSDTKPASLNAVQIQVDKGVSVALSDLTIRPS